jgi:hypothetical protein
MAYTFLQAVNLVGNRIGVVAGDAAAFTSFTDSARQRDINVIIQVWNEAIRVLYGYGVFAGETAQGSITTVAATRDYALPSNFENMAGESWHNRVITQADTRLIAYEYEGGYAAMLAAQPNPNDWTGYCTRWAINTTGSTLRLDRTPVGDAIGKVWTFLYDKRLALSATTDTFPFSDSVVDSLVPPVAEVARAELNNKTKNPAYAQALFVRAVSFAMKTGPRNQYGTYRPQGSVESYQGPFVP